MTEKPNSIENDAVLRWLPNAVQEQIQSQLPNLVKEHWHTVVNCHRKKLLDLKEVNLMKIEARYKPFNWANFESSQSCVWLS
jgi:hypothetical protein